MLLGSYTGFFFDAPTESLLTGLNTAPCLQQAVFVPNTAPNWFLSLSLSHLVKKDHLDKKPNVENLAKKNICLISDPSPFHLIDPSRISTWHKNWLTSPGRVPWLSKTKAHHFSDLLT